MQPTPANLMPPPTSPPKGPWEYTRAERLKRRLAALPVVVKVLAGVVAVALLAGGYSLIPDDDPAAERDPYLHHEATSWPDARDFAVAKAAATEHLDAEQVGDVLGDVRMALIAGRVDWPQGEHDRSGLIRRVAPDLRDWFNEVLDGPDRLLLVSEIAAGVTVSAAPRVNGMVEYEETEDEEGNLVLRVTADLTFAYALLTEGRVQPRVVTFNTVTVWDALAEEGGSAQGLWLVDGHWEARGVDCGYLYEGSLGASGTYPGEPSAAPSVEIENC